jgi:hypothetical protein
MAAVRTKILLTPGFSPAQSRNTEKPVSTVSREMKPLKRLVFKISGPPG